jgi:hypothetical protein
VVVEMEEMEIRQQPKEVMEAQILVAEEEVEGITVHHQRSEDQEVAGLL